MATITFKLMFKTPGGHRYWMGTDRKVYVSDESGYLPTDCEHDLLVLDREGVVRACKGGGFTIPVIEHPSTGGIEYTRTPADAREAGEVCARFGLMLEVGGNIFNAVRRD